MNRERHPAPDLGIEPNVGKASDVVHGKWLEPDVDAFQDNRFAQLWVAICLASAGGSVLADLDLTIELV